MMKKSKAILYKDELVEHMSEEDNHYLYDLRDDQTITLWMSYPFEIRDGETVVMKGVCGDGITCDLTNNTISVERG